MGRTFRRNSEDSYKYGSNRRPKKQSTSKPKKYPSKKESEDAGFEKDWQKTFEEINGILEDDNGKRPIES
jgi:hypothetical protein